MTFPNPLKDLLNIRYPIIRAPMAGVSTPELAAGVSNAGGLGSIGIGASSTDELIENLVRECGFGSKDA